MIPNSHITIYNKYIENRAEKYKRSVIRDVVWQSTDAIARAKEQVASNSALIMIPFAQGADYQKPKVWKVARTGWTLQEGDTVVRGVVSEEIDTEYGVANLQKDYDDVLMIFSIAAMDEGSANVQHWEVNCK